MSERSYRAPARPRVVSDIGIYVIRCEITRFVYVGASTNMGARWRQHRWLLARVRHPNPWMQSEWTTLADEFVFERVLCYPRRRDWSTSRRVALWLKEHETIVIHQFEEAGYALYNTWEWEKIAHDNDRLATRPPG